jgi:hypothetical protein
MATRVLICGSRDFSNKKVIESTVEKLPPDATIIQGGAKGADALAKQAANERGIHCLEFKADWVKFGLSAGPIRNRQMLVEGKPDVVYAFYSDGIRSRGTKGMVEMAQRAGIPVHEFDCEGIPL